jgi:hypothetical protein
MRPSTTVFFVDRFFERMSTLKAGSHGEQDHGLMRDQPEEHGKSGDKQKHKIAERWQPRLRFRCVKALNGTQEFSKALNSVLKFSGNLNSIDVWPPLPE